MSRARELADLLTGGQTITTADNTDQLALKSTDADASVGPVLRMNRDSGSPADNDLLGSIIFQADDDGGNSINFVEVITQMEDASAGSRSADLFLKTRTNGSLVSRIGMYDSTTAINDDGADIDFRVESSNNTAMLFVDAGNDRVGISTNSPIANLEVEDGGTSNSILTKITADDQNPYAFMVGNDTYSSTDSNGFGFVQRNDGAAYIYNAGALRAAFHNVSGGVLSLAGGVVLGAGAANSTAANTLDDYEEGNFTATIHSGISVSSYDHQLGHYVKVGRQVTAWVFMEYNGSSRTGDILKIAGLPFTSSNSTSNESTFGGFITYQNNFSNAHNIVHVGRGDTKIEFYEVDGSQLIGSELSGASGEVRVVVQYTVA